jgi:hypothetical protein
MTENAERPVMHTERSRINIGGTPAKATTDGSLNIRN